MPHAICFTGDGGKTPQDVLSELRQEFFFMDEIGPGDSDQLCKTASWGAVVWLEVDASHVEPWLRKAKQQADMGKTIVALLPARTNTRAFHQYVLGYASELRFIVGRLKYNGRKHQAPFASVVAIFQRSITQECKGRETAARLDVVAF
jgi:hypothetical protein